MIPRPAAGRRRALFVLALAVLAGCAKKMLPPSPDRFAPRLVEINTRNRSRLELVFNEDIDARRVESESLRIIGPDGAELAVRGAVAGRRGAWLEVWTMPQAEQVYEAAGLVYDRAGNPGRFRARFRGSTRADTTAPRVERVGPGPGTENHFRGFVTVKFSEPVDTTARPEYRFAPARLGSSYRPSWESDWQELSLMPGFGPDSGDSASRFDLPEGRPVYFLLLPTLADLEGNRLVEPAATWFTTDTLTEWVPVKGLAEHPDTLRRGGVVLFDSDSTPGLGVLLRDGSFSTRLAPGEYRVTALGDTDGDGLYDLRAGPREFNTAAGSLFFRLEPESLPRALDDYRR